MTPSTARRDQLLDVAGELVAREGVASLSMRRLAAAAGIRAPSLYKHFASRTEVVGALQERALLLLTGELVTVDAPDGCLPLLLAYRSWALAHPHEYELISRGPLERSHVRRDVEDGAAAPALALAGDELDARVLWAAAHGLVDLELQQRFPPDADLEATWVRAAELIDRALAPPPHHSAQHRQNPVGNRGV